MPRRPLNARQLRRAKERGGRVGDRVCPDLAEALVRANYQERALAEVAA